MDNKSDEQEIQILKNIEQLQSIEKSLYKELEGPTPPANADSIITRINQLADIRISLFKSLNNTYKSLQKNVNNSRTELVELLTVVNIVEKELNNAKIQLNQLYDIKHNKMRMVEINTYYGKQYQAQGRLMKLIILVGVILLILAILWKNGFLPDFIAKLLLAIVIGGGGFLILWRLLDISTRDNMNFDAYNWNFNPETQKPTVYEYDKSKLLGLTADLDQGFNGLDCIGDACCTAGMKYDTAMRKCIKSASLETFVTGQLTNHCFKNVKQNHGDGGSQAMPYGDLDTINFASV
jgi:hypothetical protein